MDGSEPFSSAYSQPASPSYNALAKPSGSRSSGLTLVLPALKGGKPIKVGTKSKQRFGSYGLQEEEKKIARPVKLKPLKEVLKKLVGQIKKKDDYAFFLKPVDVTQVQGYMDIVKRPMDLGTMSAKVDRGKYRSLEEFASDLRLVTSNAKAFNPPGTIYYTEAERIEAWALDHISKAAATVIQYETDWNIEIENDDEAIPVNVDDDEDYNVGTPMDVDDTGRGGRSPSVMSQVQPGTSRRAARGPYKKTTAPTNKVPESIDADGRPPGSRDGLGAFPPGSNWAKTTLALKLKGKRYKTKKERLRIEKEGPPLLADGSLDYTEMEDPYSVLSFFAPEPFTRPYVTPLHPPLFTTPAFQPQYDPSSSHSQSQQPRPPPTFHTSINLPLDHESPPLRIPGASTTNGSSSSKRRHWMIVRNPTRTKWKDKDDEAEPAEAPTWQTPRETNVADYGSYAVLAGTLEEEVRRRKVVGKEGEEEHKVLEVLRDTLDCEASTLAPTKSDTAPRTQYWNAQRASIAEAYIRDLVYGGIDGLAYVRSLAEFLTPNPDIHEFSELGSLATWVEREVVDDLTGGRHALLREAAVELARQMSETSAPPSHQPMYTQVRNSLYLYPTATVALAALLQIKTHKIDMGALIKTPEELFQSEEEWAGKAFKERLKVRAKEPVKTEESTDGVGLEVEEPERTWMDVDTSSQGPNGLDAEYELEGPEELNEVMEFVADAIVSLDKELKQDGVKARLRLSDSHLSSDIKAEVNETGEDPALRNLRLNLLALAKRAPLDTIARLPKDLVPEHIRHFVPTLSASG